MQTRLEKGNASEVAATEASSEVSQTTKKGTIMSNFTSALTIGETSVRQVGCLFSLNDLHKAAGSEAKHEPNQFTRLDQTQALIAEIKSADSRNCIETRRGANGGTYACRELVIAYAAWISAAFHLKVIRVFLAVAAPQPTPYTVQPSDTLNEPQQIALRAMLESNVKRLPHAKQAGAMVKGWSKLKAHFGVPYRQIPAGEFEEALSIIARHVSEWELVDEAPSAPTLRNRRWLLATDFEGREVVQPIPDDASIISFTKDSYYGIVERIPMERLSDMLAELQKRVAGHIGAFSEHLQRERIQRAA